MVLVYLTLIVRALVFLLFAVATVIAVTHWAVKHGHLQPFGPLPQTVRRLGQPFLRPLERRLYRSGGNPASAPYLFFWVALFGGLALIAAVQWIAGFVLDLGTSAAGGPRSLIAFLVDAAFSVLMIALLVQVVASWIGASPYSRPMRVVRGLTDWLLQPLRKVIPPLGVIDITPLVAYLILSLARGFLLRLI
jgi:YggT family protein